MSRTIEIKFKITAPPGGTPGEAEELADMLLKLAETMAEITGSPKPIMRRIKDEQNDQAGG